MNTRITTKRATVKIPTLRHEAMELASSLKKNEYRLSLIISDIYANLSFKDWGYPGFKEYCEEELGIYYRKGLWLKDIGNKIKELKLTDKELEGIDWTKLKEIASVLTEENKDEILENIKNKTVSEVQEYSKSIKTKTEIIEKKVKLVFVVSEESARVIEEALASIGEEIKNHSKSFQLEIMAVESLASRNPNFLKQFKKKESKISGEH
jgi:hypothetical protein